MYIRIDTKLIKEIIVYAIIGGISAGLDSILFAVISMIGVNLYIANFISVNIGIITSFILNTRFNFKIKDNIQKRLIRFLTIGYVGMSISTVILYIGKELWGIDAILVKLISVVVVAILQFILNKLITYRKGIN